LSSTLEILINILSIFLVKNRVVVLSEIEEFVKALVKGDHKKAVEIAKAVLEESQLKDKWVELAWRGWLAGLEKLSQTSLIVSLMNGLSSEDAKRYANYLESLAQVFSSNLPDRSGFAKGFLKSWVDLLNSYAALKEDRSSQ